MSVLNVREHWAARARRAKRHRNDAFLNMRAAAMAFPLPCVVMLTRISPRSLDLGDNLNSSMKNCRDGVADWLKVDDSDPRVQWGYAQRKGRVGQRAIEIKVEVA